MEIRLAGSSDVSVVREIVETAYLPWVPVVGVRPRPLDASYESLVDAGVVWVIGDPVVGLIVLIDEPDGLLIENVAVHPEHHGRGIGKALMRFAETRGRSRLRLYTHHLMTSNLTLYERLGYVRGRFEDPVIHMSKTL